ncbi:MAG: GNAT family N-acetyltransferase [Tepidiformaceae bacterium]
MTIAVRPCVSADARALYPVWLAVRHHNAGIDARVVLAPVSEPEFRAGLDESLRRDFSAAYVAEDSGRLVGFISARIEAGQPDRLPEQHATIGYLYVGPGYRRKGIARQLVAAVREWAGGQEGISHIEMPVLAADAEAAAFWRSLGFSPFIERLWASLQDDPGDDAPARR